MFLRAWRGGRRIELAQELARGGEGIIYQVADHAEQVAKVFLAPPGREKVAKVSAMIAGATPELGEISAWPGDLLLGKDGHPVGFSMRKIAFAEGIHELYSPRSRALRFPEADLRFLVLVAANMARAFGQIHAAGHIIGDVNHNNLLTSHDGLVNLIDCDSFQIKAGSTTYTCDVGVPLFTAPELQGRAFRGLVRTQQHDLFGLALLVFHLLFMGRHPYAGIWQGSNYAGIEDHIRARRFAYGAQRAKSGIERPPNTVALETFGPDIAELFEQAFGSAVGAPRPQVTTWMTALTTLAGRLVRCPEVASHSYHVSQVACPWCPLERATGARLFGRRFEPVGAELVDVSSLWRAIEAVPAMAEGPPVPSETAPAPGARALPERAAQPGGRRLVAAVVLLAGGGLTAMTSSTSVFVVTMLLAAAIWPWVSARARADIIRRYDEAEAHHEALAQRWSSQASRRPFLEVQDSLGKLRYSLDDLERTRRRRLDEAASEPGQRRRYLSRFTLDTAAISLLDEDRKQTLIGVYGIETAADITAEAITQVRGLGLAASDALLQWRAAQEQSFVFKSGAEPAPEVAAAIEEDIAERRQAIIRTLQEGPKRLEQARKSIEEARRRLREPLLQAWEALDAAKRERERL